MIKNYKKNLTRLLLGLAIMMPNLIFAQARITGMVSSAKALKPLQVYQSPLRGLVRAHQQTRMVSIPLMRLVTQP